MVAPRRDDRFGLLGNLEQVIVVPRPDGLGMLVQLLGVLGPVGEPVPQKDGLIAPIPRILDTASECLVVLALIGRAGPNARFFA